MRITIYHNPRCSKSRQALALLEEKGKDIEIVEYLKNPPTKDRVEELLNSLGVEPRQLMRRQEAIYKELGLNDDSLSREQLIEAMVNHPKLIERPIVVNGSRAAIGRPPEKILEIL